MAILKGLSRRLTQQQDKNLGLEIKNDPQSIGYAGKTPRQVVGLLNNKPLTANPNPQENILSKVDSEEILAVFGKARWDTIKADGNGAVLDRMVFGFSKVNPNLGLFSECLSALVSGYE